MICVNIYGIDFTLSPLSISSLESQTDFRKIYGIGTNFCFDFMSEQEYFTNKINIRK